MNEPNESADRAFEARAQAAFRASVARLDGGRRSRLNQARQLALAEVADPEFTGPLNEGERLVVCAVIPCEVTAGG